MTITVSKINYGVVVGPTDGAVTVTKINYGLVIGPTAGALTVTKLNYGIVYDPNTPGPIASTWKPKIIVC